MSRKQWGRQMLWNMCEPNGEKQRQKKIADSARQDSSAESNKEIIDMCLDLIKPRQQ
jgi:hypothetical protein